MNQKIFGIHGLARSGKDVFSDYLLDACGGLAGRYSFASPIYRMLEVLLGELPTYVDDNGAVQYDKNAIINPYDKSLRYMLQTLGTEWGRNLIDDDIWVFDALKYVTENTKTVGQFIFTDIRFVNEALFVRELGGVVIHITREQRDSIDNQSHASEGMLPGNLVDRVVRNNDTLESLQSVANQVYANYDRMVKSRPVCNE